MEKRLKLPINAVRPNKTLQVHESYSENRFKILDNLNTPKTTGNFQNITFSFLAKQNEKLLKNKDKIILSSKLKKTNDNRRLFIDHPIKVSTHKTRKIDSIPRSKNSSTYVVSKSPYLRKIPKSQNFYVNKTKRNTETEIHNIFDLNYINSPTTIKKPKPCLYYGNMDLVNYDKNSESFKNNSIAANKIIGRNSVKKSITRHNTNLTSSNLDDFVDKENDTFNSGKIKKFNKKKHLAKIIQIDSPIYEKSRKISKIKNLALSSNNFDEIKNEKKNEDDNFSKVSTKTYKKMKIKHKK